MLSSLNTAVSGMNSAQIALSTTGHNIANSGTYGYSRQRIVASDAFYRSVSSMSNYKYNQVGSGVNTTSIQRVRNEFLDASYRTESTKLGYYEVKTMVGEFVELTSGEMNGNYSIQNSITDLWNSLQEAVQNPESLDKRASLVSDATLFMDSMSNAYKDLADYQDNLDSQVRQNVEKINLLAAEIAELNSKIRSIEISGDNANDYRDQLNVAVEELNNIVNVRMEERVNGSVDVFINGQPLISDGMVNHIGLQYTDASGDFVEPIFTESKDIIPYDQAGTRRIFSLTGGNSDTDQGSLRALLETRGIRSETYASDPVAPDPADYTLGTKDPQYQEDYFQYKRQVYNVEQSTIPKAMKNLDKIFNRIVTVINDAIAPRDHDSSTAPVGVDSDNTQFFELFTRKKTDRYDASGTYIEEDTITSFGDDLERSTLYSISQVEINPALLELDGYQKLPLSANGDIGNPNAVIEALDAWNDATITFDDSSAKYNISDAYTHMTTLQASETEANRQSYESQISLVTQLDNYREAVSGVSTDEEMSNLIVYQRSYQAAARVVTVIDSMIDTIVNNMV